MDALGLQSLISMYDNGANTEVCAISKYISINSLGTSSVGATEITRYVTNGSIQMLGMITGQARLGYSCPLDTSSNNMMLLVASNNATLFSFGPSDISNGLTCNIFVTIDNNTILIKGLQIGSGNNNWVSIFFIFVVFH